MGNEHDWKNLVTMVNNAYSNETEINLSVETENFAAIISVIPEDVEEDNEKLTIFRGFDIYNINRKSMEYDEDFNRYVCRGSDYVITVYEE